MRIKYKTRKTITQILSIVLLCALGVGAVFGVSALSKKLKEDTKVVHPTFEVGGIGDDGRGIADETGSIFTKEAFECQGLEVKLDFDSNVTYQAFYYDDLDTYLSSSEVLDVSKKLAVPANATYARLVVTPIWDVDVKDDDRVVHWYEVIKYSSQLEIFVNKEQEVLNIKGPNQFVYNESVRISMAGGTKGFALSDAGNGSYNASSLISTKNCSNICIKINETTFDNVSIALFGETSYINGLKLSETEYERTTYNGEVYITLSVPATCEGICIYSNKTVDFSNYEVYVW